MTPSFYVDYTHFICLHTYCTIYITFSKN